MREIGLLLCLLHSFLCSERRSSPLPLPSRLSAVPIQEMDFHFHRVSWPCGLGIIRILKDSELTKVQAGMPIHRAVPSAGGGGSSADLCAQLLVT
jgi:hypothetical protein